MHFTDRFHSRTHFDDIRFQNVQRSNDLRQERTGMRIGGMIFARMGSSRLPGKPLLPIGSRTLLGHVVDRARRSRGLTGLALATSTRPEDDVLAEFAEAEAMPCWRGPSRNVAARAMGCAESQGWDAFARICADRVFLDPAAMDAAVARMVAGARRRIDLVSNVPGAEVARGLTVEVVRTSALGTVLARSNDPEDLEHITRFIYRNRIEFRIETLGLPRLEAEGLSFSVDTPSDLARARAVVSKLTTPANAPLGRVVRLMREMEMCSAV